ncbi:3'-5' exonuclease [Pseudobutyrivibrio ruminis]|uniref:3'-5' exonuclease n=1 Tax=Pseudobutyrivibrio ruminis TaxID=46206 RepID=UPI0004056ADE|nr:3'-5' exonuclease [Pseudobutyrivibrio ruminis]
MAEKLYDAYHQEIELTDEQQACLKYSGDRTLMVKGYAGAGKSLVLMQAARKLVEKYGPDAKNKVAIFTFQNTLVSTTREFLQVNGTAEDGVLVNTINSYISDLYELLTVCGAAPKRKYPWGRNAEKTRIENVNKAIRAHQTKYGKHRFHSIEPEFWIEEFDWMKDMNIWKDDMDLYLTIPRKGRGGKVRMSANDRVTAYQLFTCYCEHLERTKQADWADQTLFIVRHPELIPDRMKFDYILIDEAQDLSLAQMTAIMMLYNKNMIVAMDANQRIFNKQWTAKQLGIETTTKKLTKSMRTTKQIDALAESVRSKNDAILSEDDRSLRAIPEREGNIPELVHLEDAAAERKYVVNLVKKYQESNDRITIGIIAAKNKQIPIYAEWFASENIQHEQVKKDSTFSMAKPGVKIASAYGAKGLEFDVVIIPMFAEGNFPYAYQPEDEESYEQYMIQMRNLVYVSMTRAKFHLVLTFWGKGSRFIADMNSDLYKLVGEKPNITVPCFTPKVEIKKEKPASVEKETKSRPTLLQTDYSGNTVNKKTNSEDAKVEKNTAEDLVSFLANNGLEVLDKRPKNGALWVVGDKSIDPILQETKKKFGARWTYKEEGGLATKHRPSWYTKSEK